MKQTFVRLDIFRKLPKDLTEPTFCGALGMPAIKNTYSFLRLYCASSSVVHDRSWQILDCWDQEWHACWHLAQRRSPKHQCRHRISQATLWGCHLGRL